ncbi:solute carrier family 35 member E1-like protein [Dinothrombium tinctorium]|uniref:Solute carrier family 35 member E1-like protein n=1 Tax=Dinothrombium tinctorium TaxID=1965070 RepID=A0A3S3SKG4_9ACAR|nr:solute carrier family 35 member E1-like protein [Dinothrombium tinctorium]
MDSNLVWKEIIVIVLLCLLWFSISSANNIVTKHILNSWSHPLSVTLMQLSSIYLYLKPSMYAFAVERKALKKQLILLYIIPLSFGKFLASVSSHFSLVKVSVSYSHTVKSLMPLFVVILSRIILKEKQSKKIYCSLMPIIGGVLISTATELSFDTLGLLAALSSTLIFSFLQIFSKKLLNITKMSPLALLSLLSKYSLLFFTPIWLFYDFFSIYESKDDFSLEIFTLLLFDGFLSFAQNLIAFILISKVSPLTYSIANVTKRITVIVFSILVFRNPITATNVFGITLAISGLFAYNKFKYDEHVRRKAEESQLPLYKNQNNFHSNSSNHHFQSNLLLMNNHHDHKLLKNNVAFY